MFNKPIVAQSLRSLSQVKYILPDFLHNARLVNLDYTFTHRLYIRDEKLFSK